MNDKQLQEIARYFTGLAIIASASFTAYLWGRLDLDVISAIMLAVIVPILLAISVYLRKD